MYVRVMIGVLLMLWGIIAVAAIHRRPAMTPSLLLGPGDLPRQPLDVTPILNHPVGDLLLKNVEFGAALETLRQRTEANIIVRWDILAKIGILPETPVSASVFDASFETSLNAILHSLHGELEFGMSDGGTIVITLMPASPPMLIVYDVRDLAPQEAPPPPPPPTAGGIGPGGGGGGSGGVFGPSPMSSMVSQNQADLLEAVGASLYRRVKHIENDQQPAIADSFAGRWIVMQPPETHRRLQDILRQLRATNARNQSGKAAP